MKIKTTLKLFFFFNVGISLFAQYSFQNHPLASFDDIALATSGKILEILEVRGKVYTIRIDETLLTQNGTRVTEGRRNIRFTALFDDKGRLAEESYYNEGSELAKRGGFIPAVEEEPETFQVFFNRANRILLSTPTRTETGLITQEALVRNDGSTDTMNHTWEGTLLKQSKDSRTDIRYRYDSQGLLAEIVAQRTEETPITTRVTRNASGQTLEVTQTQNSAVIMKGNLSYNEQGHLVSEIWSQLGKNYRADYTLHDANGNWSKKVISEVMPDGTLNPIRANYRRVNYY